MLSYPSTISLSSSALNHLADRIRSHGNQRRSRWRRLGAGRQALLALAHLRNGETYTQLGPDGVHLAAEALDRSAGTELRGAAPL